MADFRISRDGTIVICLSRRAKQIKLGRARTQIPRSLVYRTREETARFVRLREAEGFVFFGRRFLADLFDSNEGASGNVPTEHSPSSLSRQNA